MRKLFVLFLILTMSASMVMAQKLPNIHILATGGTIAGAGASSTGTTYKAGQVGIDVLVRAVPQLKLIANIKEEQVVKIGSQDMTDEVWLTLAARVNELLGMDNVDGIVITHGTDTMEETAYFLNLVVKSDKPVVLVGAMRPSTSLSADGPLNLYNAVVVAGHISSRNRGVMVVMNGSILGAHSVMKMNTTDVQAFASPNSGALGYVLNNKPFYNQETTKLHTRQSVFDVTNMTSLPKVGIVYSYSNVGEEAVKALIDGGYKGIIHAGVGNGNIHMNIFDNLISARGKGIQIVRSTRVPTGPTTQAGEVDDMKYGFIASEELNPQKARILLMLSLTKTNNWKEIQNFFELY